MSIQKTKKCDTCGKIITPTDRYLHFLFYGWQGRDFCNETCLSQWALKNCDVRGGFPTFKVS